MLTIRGLSKTYGAADRRRVISGLDFDLPDDDFVAVMGESGIGKSTLLNLVAGLDVPDAGTIAIDDTVVSSLDDHARTLFRRKHIGFIFQAFHLLPRLTLAQNIALPLSLLGVDAGEASQRVQSMLARLNLADRGADLPRTLSSGQMQRNLDPDNASLVLDLLRHELDASGAAAILVTHSHAAAATARRTLRMTAGGLEPA
jgi:putative ABC transport system ATP-binding protein